MIAPRRRASSVTWWPMRRSTGCSTSSIPVIVPRRRISFDRGVGGERLQQLPEQLELRLQPLERALGLEDVERRQRGGAGERVAGVGVAVEEGAELLVRAEEALVDALGGERRGQRHVAAGDALGDAHQVRRDVLVLAGEHAPGAAEAGRDLVAGSAARRGGRRARAPRAGSPRGARSSRPRPAPAAPSSPPPARGRGPRTGARAARRRPARSGACRTAAAGRASGRGRSRRPRPSRSCPRGRRRAGDRKRRALLLAALLASTGRPS